MNTWSIYPILAKLLNAGLAILLCLQPISLAPQVQDAGVLFAIPSGLSGDCSRAQPCLFREALARAGEGDTIYFAKGDYHLSEQDPEGGETIRITASISLLGGWDGNPGEDGSRTVRDPREIISLIISQGSCNGITIAGSEGTNPISPVIDGFTITSGTSSPDCQQEINSPGGYAIRSDHANPTISHNIFQDGRGAAIIFLEDSSATIDSNLFLNVTPSAESGSLAAISAQANTAITAPLLIANNFLVGTLKAMIFYPHSRWMSSNQARSLSRYFSIRLLAFRPGLSW